MADVTLPTREVTDFDTFHTACARALGFPSFYGRNMNAWIDCLSYLRDPGDGMTSVKLGEGEQLILEIPGSMALRQRAPEVFDGLVECTAAVNARYVQSGERAAIALVLA